MPENLPGDEKSALNNAILPIQRGFFLSKKSSRGFWEFDQDSFYRVIRISDFQFVRDCKNEQEILGKIKNSFADIQNPQDSPFAHLSRQMREILSTLPADALERTWHELEGTHKPLWQPGQDFAVSLARLLFRESEKSLSNMRLMVEQLANVLDKDKARKMLELVRGLWVNAEAAGALAWIRDNRAAALINGEEVHDFTGHSYIRRCWPYPRDYKLLSAGDCRSLDEFQDILLEKFTGSAGKQHAKRRLKRYEQPLFLVFPFVDSAGAGGMDSYPDAELVDKIREEHPNVTPVVSTGARIPDNLHYLEAVLPEIEAGQENKQFHLYYDVPDNLKLLVVITTNAERALPSAFLRRCVTLELQLPHAETLVKIAEHHFRIIARRKKPLYESVARKYLEICGKARGQDRRSPGTSEYLDAVRACLELKVTPDSEIWRQIEQATLDKATGA